MEFKIVKTLEELPKFSSDLPIFADIETGGLYTDFRMIQLYQPETSQTIYVLDIASIGYDKMNYILELEKLKNYLNTMWTVWYNASYDLGTLNISPALHGGKVDDLYYLVKDAYAEFVKDGFGLKKIVKKFRELNDLYKDIGEDHGAKGFPKGSYVSRAAYLYAVTDVYALAELWKKAKIQEVRKKTSYIVDMLSQGYALQYQQNGLVLNRELWKIDLDKATENLEVTEALLPAGLNVNSPKQIKEYLGTDSSNAETLIAYALSSRDNAEEAKHILDLRRYRKQQKYLLSINYNKMYTKFNVAGAGTGRFTATGGDLENGFNAQQIPRNYQHLFNADTVDTEVIGLDYSTLELRLVAEIFGEPEMNRQLREGEDLHTAMAMLTSGKKLHEDGVLKSEVMNTGKAGSLDSMGGEYIDTLDRTIGKSMNFGLVFGMSWKTYQRYVYANFGIELSDKEAQKFRDTYFRKYKKIGSYHRNVWNNYSKPTFYVYTALGRKIKPKLGTDGINAPIQGSGAETTKLAVHYLIKDNEEIPYLEYIYNVVHDAVYLRVPIGTKDLHKKNLEVAMLKAWDEISKTKAFQFKSTPMKVD